MTCVFESNSRPLVVSPGRNGLSGLALSRALPSTLSFLARLTPNRKRASRTLKRVIPGRLRLLSMGRFDLARLLCLTGPQSIVRVSRLFPWMRLFVPPVRPKAS